MDEVRIAGVSVVLPIKGLDPQATDHYSRWLSQKGDFPVEVIFSLQDPADPALPVLERLLQEHPDKTGKILINPVRLGMNGKSSNLHYGVEAARHDYLVMADSDIVPPLDIVRRIAAPLADPEIGLVASLPVVYGATNLWGGATAMIFNLALSVQWAPLQLLGFGKAVGASGACFAIRKDVLTAQGGFEAFGGYVAEDAEMARRIAASGKQIVLGPTVGLFQGHGSRSAFWGTVNRAALLNLYGYKVWTLMSTIFVLFMHLLVLFGGIASRNLIVVKAALVCWVIRTFCVAALQKGSDPHLRYRYALILPLVEITFAFAFVRGLFSRTYLWRGVSYQVERGGRIRMR